MAETSLAIRKAELRLEKKKAESEERKYWISTIGKTLSNPMVMAVGGTILIELLKRVDLSGQTTKTTTTNTIEWWPFGIRTETNVEDVVTPLIPPLVASGIELALIVNLAGLDNITKAWTALTETLFPIDKIIGTTAGITKMLM